MNSAGAEMTHVNAKAPTKNTVTGWSSTRGTRAVAMDGVISDGAIKAAIIFYLAAESRFPSDGIFLMGIRSASTPADGACRRGETPFSSAALARSRVESDDADLGVPIPETVMASETVSTPMRLFSVGHSTSHPSPLRMKYNRHNRSSLPSNQDLF